MTPNDRRQIVVKTSAFHGYEGEHVLSLGPFGMGAEAVASAGLSFTLWRAYVPEPFQAEQLMLSSLGGWLRSHGSWPVVRKAAPRFRFDAPNLGDLAPYLAPVHRDARPDDPRAGLQAAMIRPPWLEALQPKPDEVLDCRSGCTSPRRDATTTAVVYGGRAVPSTIAPPVKSPSASSRTGRRRRRAPVPAQLHRRSRAREGVRSRPRDAVQEVRVTTTVTPDIAPPAYEPADRGLWVR